MKYNILSPRQLIDQGRGWGITPISPHEAICKDSALRGVERGPLYPKEISPVVAKGTTVGRYPELVDRGLIMRFGVRIKSRKHGLPGNVCNRLGKRTRSSPFLRFPVLNFGCYCISYIPLSLEALPWPRPNWTLCTVLQPLARCCCQG